MDSDTLIQGTSAGCIQLYRRIRIYLRFPTYVREDRTINLSESDLISKHLNTDFSLILITLLPLKFRRRWVQRPKDVKEKRNNNRRRLT